MIELTSDTALGTAISAAYEDARADDFFKDRLRRRLMLSFTKFGTKPGRANRAWLWFVLAGVVDALVIAYGLWLPGSMRFG